MSINFRSPNPFKRTVRVIDVLAIAEQVLSENSLDDNVACALATVVARIVEKVEREAADDSRWEDLSR